MLSFVSKCHNSGKFGAGRCFACRHTLIGWCVHGLMCSQAHYFCKSDLILCAAQKILMWKCCCICVLSYCFTDWGIIHWCTCGVTWLEGMWRCRITGCSHLFGLISHSRERDLQTQICLSPFLKHIFSFFWNSTIALGKCLYFFGFWTRHGLIVIHYNQTSVVFPGCLCQPPWQLRGQWTLLFPVIYRLVLWWLFMWPFCDLEPTGKEKKWGRPRNPWRNDQEAEIKRMSYTWGQLERLAQDQDVLAQDQDVWRALVGGLCSTRGLWQWWWWGLWGLPCQTPGFIGSLPGISVLWFG